MNPLEERQKFIDTPSLKGTRAAPESDMVVTETSIPWTANESRRPPNISPQGVTVGRAGRMDKVKRC